MGLSRWQKKMEAEDREKVICVLRAINWEQFFRVRVLDQGVRRRGQDGGQGHHGRVQDQSSHQSSACHVFMWVRSFCVNNLTNLSLLYLLFSGGGHSLNTWSLCSAIVHLFHKIIFQRVFLSIARKLKSLEHLLKWQEEAAWTDYAEVPMTRPEGTNSTAIGIEHLLKLTYILIIS